MRLTYALVDAVCVAIPAAGPVTFDIDDTCDVVHGHQQLSLFNAHYDERCFLPIHVYDARRLVRWWLCCGQARRRAVSRCAAMCGAWCGVSAAMAQTRITFRGDGH